MTFKLAEIINETQKVLIINEIIDKLYDIKISNLFVKTSSKKASQRI